MLTSPGPLARLVYALAFVALAAAPAVAASLPSDVPVAGEAADDLLDAYNRAVKDAAIKRKSFEKRLTPIDGGKSEVRLVAFRWIGASDLTDANGRLNNSYFVALPKEIKAACKGAGGEVLALQQILGLPPRTGEYVFVEFSIATKKVFRPCASGPEVTTTSCSFDLPKEAAVRARAADPEFAETQAFVFQQMWSSYTRNVPDNESFGYPFTAMGWTYDWNPEAEDTYGVSEYIAKGGAPVRGVQKIAPKTYCR
jgi:hypothetical protein